MHKSAPLISWIMPLSTRATLSFWKLITVQGSPTKHLWMSVLPWSGPQLCNSFKCHVTLLRASECANVSETLLSKFTLAVNHGPGQLAVATGQVGLSGWQPQSCSSETRALTDDYASSVSEVPCQLVLTKCYFDWYFRLQSRVLKHSNRSN